MGIVCLHVRLICALNYYLLTYLLTYVFMCCTGSAGVLVGHPLDTIKVRHNGHSSAYSHAAE